jgi:phage shock protein PspC (stress-responsive transcriptional regulator)
MDKAIKINLAGTVFQIEEDAYRLLRDYLNAIESRLKNSSGGNETLDDIEARIAEIFQSQKGITGVISKENVEAMIAIIGKPEDFDQSYQSPSEPHPYTSSYRKRLYRNPEDSIISGVCGGIGAYLNFDPVWVRLIFVIFTFSFGIGLLIYLALWIALPDARSESQKRELYGDYYHTRSAGKKYESTGAAASDRQYGRNTGVNNAGNALNEIFRAIGKFLYIVFRIILIAFGVTFVLAGFATMVTFIMTFFFNYPWFFYSESFHPELFRMSDMLDFLMRPELTPWVIALLSIVVILPLLALIYWGLKMIFWFRVKDWIVSLTALVIWVMSICALSLIMFNQGISFAETGRRIDQTTIETSHDTIYLKIDKKISSLAYDHEISIPEDEYALYINKRGNLLYGRPELNIHNTDNRNASIRVERYSHGKSRREATEKAESFIYNYRFSNDTVYLDQYYNVPTSHKWSGSWVEVDIYLPANTIIWIDNEAEILLDRWVGNEVDSWEIAGKYWKWTEDGPERASSENSE